MMWQPDPDAFVLDLETKPAAQGALMFREDLRSHADAQLACDFLETIT